MNIPIPDVMQMTADKFVMWIAAIVLGYLLLINPLSIGSRLERISELQAQMVQEHKDLLRGIQAQCINHAENVDDRDRRARQLHRCLTLEVSSGIEAK